MKAVPFVAVLFLAAAASAQSPPASTDFRLALHPSMLDAVRTPALEHAVALEMSRRFATAACTDLDGHLWIACENPPDSLAGAVQCYDPAKSLYEAFTEFTIKDGLAENSATALACDSRGRIWVGHNAHGVSVFNGQTWRNYETVAGLSSPTSNAGPLGEHIFRIVISPTDHDVWLATSLGLARYSDAHDTWSYYTRADGLPSDQINSLAFAKDGTIYVATQCDGIAIASPSDNYKVWKQVSAPETPPPAATGKGLPSNLINDILVAHDGAIYAATCAGLATSTDHGLTWTFLRGKDYVDKVTNSIAGPPAPNWTPAPAALPEDDCTALAEDPTGIIWVGTRGHGAAPLHTDAISAIPANAPATALLADDHALSFVATYGQGVIPWSSLQLAAHPHPAALLPSGQSPAAARDILSHRKPMDSPPKAVPITFIGDDYATRGAWVGRYGRAYSNLCAGNGGDETIPIGLTGTSFRLRTTLGPHTGAVGNGKRNWLQGLYSDDPDALWNNFIGARRQSQWNDHADAFPPTWEGPDLLLNFHIPEGLFRISFYIEDYDAHTAPAPNSRDLVIAAGPTPADGQPFIPIVQTRVQHAFHGVYKQFLLFGDQDCQFYIHRNFSRNAILTGLFIDRLAGPPGNFANGPLGCMGNVRYDAPIAPGPAELPGDIAALTDHFIFPTDPDTLGAITPSLAADRLLAYRAAAGSNAPAQLLDAWRWAIPLMSPDDHTSWAAKMEEGWAGFVAINPRSKRAGPATAPAAK